jgi:hypothetical protein
MFSDDIIRAADGEAIEAIVIGRFGWGSIHESDEEAYGFARSARVPVPQTLKGQVLTWDEAEPYLRYSYDGGFGAPEVHAITAWTKSKVITVHEYDGATSLQFVARNPMAHEPGM